MTRLAPGARATPYAVAALLLLVALLLQLSVVDAFAWNGVVPDLVLLVVVGLGLARGSQFGLILGFAAGVGLDLAPPADHLAGRWALSLLVVGLVAGLVRESGVLDTIATPSLGSRRAWAQRIAPLAVTAAVCSFAGTSLFALTGLLLGDTSLDVGDLLGPVLQALVWDVPCSLIVVPAVLSAYVGRRQPATAPGTATATTTPATAAAPE